MATRRSGARCSLLTLVMLAASAQACAPGMGGNAVRPTEMTAWDALGETAGQCRTVSTFGEPLIVDWEAHQRANVEEAMHDGIAVVAYDCKSLRLLQGCSIEGTYGFMPVSKKEQLLRFESVDEVAANLPGFGIPLVRDLRAELGRDSTLDLAMILVGKRRTTVKEAARERLVGGQRCEGATHFVRGAFVGAFAMGTGTRGKASVGAGLFSVSSMSSRLSKHRDGDPETCQQAKAAESAAPESCGAILRLELVGLGALSGKGEAQSAPPTCPAGLVLAENKCTMPTGAKAHECAPDDRQGCTDQCEKGDVRSCNDLGVLYTKGEGAQRDEARALALFDKACAGGHALGCTNLGVMYDKGRGVAPSKARAIALYRKGCEEGSAAGCLFHGMKVEFGDGVGADAARAAELYRRACDGGDGQGCGYLGTMYANARGVPRDEGRALALYKRSCDGGFAHACANLGVLYERGQGVPRDATRAVALYKQGCDAGDAESCTNLGVMYEYGKGVALDTPLAVARYKQACEGGDARGCANLGTMHVNGKGVARDASRAAALLKQGCDGGNANGCINLGLLHEAGSGVAKDAGAALRVYRQGCAAGAEEACKSARRLETP